ncbi:Protein of unknown function DUF1922 [uncultured Caudovirales phage]|uniref:Uncharacterized protein n=1 Tax=uncultured Caudovirales phage TaxID=2100421 RepID=A0A6J5N4Q9_9CAUD|nr:Protein of unknown function DUF1922 [uncultured Caudovirales phage]
MPILISMDMANKKIQSYHLPASYEQEWYDKPGKLPLSRVARIFNNNDTRQMNEIQSLEVIPDEIPKPNVVTVYGLKYKQWLLIGWRCVDCGKTMAQEETRDKHPLVCDNKIKINKERILKQEEEEMPIQRIEKDGQIYFRYGTHGKMYKNRSDAEKQAQAIYAAGYQEPTNNHKGRPQSSPKVNK